MRHTTHRRQHILGMVGLLAVLSLIVPRSASAYLDPGTGSFIIQVLLAAVAGVGYLVKVFWNGIKNFFSSLFSSKRKTPPEGMSTNHDQDQKGTS